MWEGEDFCLNPTGTAVDRSGGQILPGVPGTGHQDGTAWELSVLLRKAPRVLPSQAWLSQVCLMLQGRKQLRERAESSWVRAELKEQPQFW